DRLVVELGVVEAVEQVDGAGPRGGEADARPAGELRVRGGGERGQLLVAGLDEPDLVARVVEAAEDAVDAVARVAVDPVDAPFVQAVQDEGSDGLGHGVAVPGGRWRGSAVSGRVR